MCSTTELHANPILLTFKLSLRIYFEARSYYITQTGFKLMIPLPQPLEFWVFSYVLYDSINAAICTYVPIIYSYHFFS